SPHSRGPTRGAPALVRGEGAGGRRGLHSFPTRRSSDLRAHRGGQSVRGPGDDRRRRVQRRGHGHPPGRPTGRPGHLRRAAAQPGRLGVRQAAGDPGRRGSRGRPRSTAVRKRRRARERRGIMSSKSGTPKKNMMLFAGRSHPELAEEVAKHLNVAITPQVARTFANGEIYVRYEESVRGVDAFVIQSFPPPINEWL